MRIALLSSTEFGKRCLEEGILGVEGAELAGILTTPREIQISYSRTPVLLNNWTDFGPIASQQGCPMAVMQGKMTGAAYLEHLDTWRPDLILVLGWYFMVPQKVRNSAPLGCLGIHASLLPKYRGGAPINWAIINGEGQTGVTLFELAEGVDSGDIACQKTVEIADNDDCATVYDRATAASVAMLREHLPLLVRQLETGEKAPRFAQDEHLATMMPQRKPADGLIDWRNSSKQIYDFIRAQTRPYPGAFTYARGSLLRVWKAMNPAEVQGDHPTTPATPGEIVFWDGRLAVRTGDGLILLTECQFEGDDRSFDFSETAQNGLIHLG